MNSKDAKTYWQNRHTVRTLQTSETLSNSGIKKSIGIYNEALKNLEREIESVYRNYSENTGIDIKKLSQLMEGVEQKRFFANIEKNFKKLGISPDMIDHRYLYRLNRLDALKQQIYWEVQAIARDEINATGRTYVDIMKESYKLTQADFKRVGITPTFSTLDNRTISFILQSDWVGRNYSKSIWGNVNDLADRLPELIGGAMLSGEPFAKTARRLREDFEVSVYESARLIRTEGNYFQNQAELQAYEDDGIERYEYYAILDNRTSAICETTDGNIYFVKDAIPGKNYPPLHPNCRSTTVPLLDGEESFRARKSGRQEKPKRFAQDKLQYEKWQEAMRKQMDPSQKSVVNFNQEMNLITRNFRGAELQQKLVELMNKVPQDYEQRQILENVAKLNGWRPDAQVSGSKNVTIYDAKINEKLKTINSDIRELGLDAKQRRFMGEQGVDFKAIRTGTPDEVGAYNETTNRVELDIANLDKNAKDLNIPDYKKRVVQHEIGHAIDYYATSIKKGYDYKYFSNSDEWRNITTTPKRQISAEANSIAQYRMAQSVTDKSLKDNILNMSHEAYNAMAITRESIKVGDFNFKVPRQSYDYHTQKDELFAEAYSLFNTNPKYLEEKAPSMYKFISDIIDKML